VIHSGGVLPSGTILPRLKDFRLGIILSFLMWAVSACIPVTGKVSTPAQTPLVREITATPALFTNPVLDADFPDPDVLKVGETYYAYATNSRGINVQVARSKDLVKWELLGDALPARPEWAVQKFGYVWAPEVYQPQDGDYVMYHVARYQMGHDGLQCIAAATSNRPSGPFIAHGSEPFLCQLEEGGSVDPSTFLDDDGRRYILWKNDGNCCGMQTWLYIQELAPDGLSLLGEPARLLTADQVWEGVLVEAPTLWKQAGKYTLMYSANLYNQERYAIGYATAEHILGPYTKASQPLVKTTVPAGIVGPGGQDIVVGPKGDTWLLFHGWAAEGYRRLYLAPLSWNGKGPEVNLDGRDPLPKP
jgi:arabinan endo-1,5-alpha-L-arabinosidase